MREAEARGVAEARRRAVDDVGDESEGANRLGPDAGQRQQLLEILWAAFVRREQHLAQVGGIDVRLDVHPVARRKRQRDHARDLSVHVLRFAAGELRRRDTRVGRFGGDEVEHQLRVAVARDRGVGLVDKIAYV